MLVKKTMTLTAILRFSGHHFWWLFSHMIIVAFLYKVVGWHWISIPWLPVSLVGTALAFYIGFKNNQSYDRVWEARKIWGAIVNSSRAWGSMVDAFVQTPAHNTQNTASTIVWKKELIYRQIGWLYTLREQLLVSMPWEHASLRGLFGALARRRQKQEGIGLFPDFLNEQQKARYFADIPQLSTVANKATQLLHLQAQQLAKLEEQQALHMRRQLELQQILNEFYEHQGRAERIKRFPLPRQYANLSFIFNCIFIFLLPLGIVAEFAKLGDAGVWLMVPFGAVVGWIYVVMELIGDYSENPFEGLSTDIPMLSICRAIEIDLLQMIGENEVPPAIQPVNGVLM